MIALLEALWPLVVLLRDGLPLAAGLFTRLSVLFLLLPGLGGSTVPVRIRLVVALTFLGLLLPLADGQVPAADAGMLAALVGGEAVVGLVLGFSVRVLVFALGVTGAIIAQALSLSQVLGVTSDGDSSSLLSTTLTMAGGVLFFTAGLDTEVVGLLVRNLREVPIGAAGDLDSGEVARGATLLAAEALRFGVTLAVPFMVLNFAYYLILGFLNRAMPQLMITFVGLPAITLSGLILLTIGIGPMLMVWLARISGLIAS